MKSVDDSTARPHTGIYRNLYRAKIAQETASTMAYSTPHTAREYLFGATLGICHEYALRVQHRSREQRIEIVNSTREIDLCARLASYFGPAGHLAAQGSGNVDLIVIAPTIRAEVKYLRPKKSNWAEVKKDWDWLLRISSAGNEFSKRAWLVFWPSIEIYTLTNCISIPKSYGTAYSLEDFAPFTPFAEPELPVNGANQRLRFKENVAQTSIIFMPNGKRVRVDLVGDTTHPIWCAIYSRSKPNDPILSTAPEIRITQDQIHLP